VGWGTLGLSRRKNGSRVGRKGTFSFFLRSCALYTISRLFSFAFALHRLDLHRRPSELNFSYRLQLFLPRPSLPLDPILLCISELLPKIDTLQNSPLSNKRTQGPNREIIAYLRSADLKDVLPPASPALARKFLVRSIPLSRIYLSMMQIADDIYFMCPGEQFSPTSLVWLTSLLWGEVYVSGMSPVGLWNGTQVKLFGVKAAPRGRRDIVRPLPSLDLHIRVFL
jgi:hypothetical protein